VQSFFSTLNPAALIHSPTDHSGLILQTESKREKLLQLKIAKILKSITHFQAVQWLIMHGALLLFPHILLCQSV
jgi:hypothetical protein